MSGKAGAGRCWPANIRSRSWQVQAHAGAGHAADTWRNWMEPVRKRPDILSGRDARSTRHDDLPRLGKNA